MRPDSNLEKSKSSSTSFVSLFDSFLIISIPCLVSSSFIEPSLNVSAHPLIDVRVFVFHGKLKK